MALLAVNENTPLTVGVEWWWWWWYSVVQQGRKNGRNGQSTQTEGPCGCRESRLVLLSSWGCLPGAVFRYCFYYYYYYCYFYFHYYYYDFCTVLPPAGLAAEGPLSDGMAAEPGSGLSTCKVASCSHRPPPSFHRLRALCAL